MILDDRPECEDDSTGRISVLETVIKKVPASIFDHLIESNSGL
jgi:hypothetical protein